MGMRINMTAHLVQPSVVDVFPALGDPGGVELRRIRGQSLQQVSAVTFGGLAATIVRTNDAFVDVITPAHAAGFVDVIVTTPSAVLSLLGAFEYWDPTDHGIELFDANRGLTVSGGLVSQWNDQGDDPHNVTQATNARKPTLEADQFGSEDVPIPGITGLGESGTLVGPIMTMAAKQALATGKTFFFVVKTKDARTIGATPGNVPNSIIGDASAGGWSGNAGIGGQPAGGAGRASMVNWNDGVGHFERLSFDAVISDPIDQTAAINDGQPHRIIITHSHVAPYAARAYVDGVECLTGTIDGVDQSTPLLSNYNAANLAVRDLFGGKTFDTDFAIDTPDDRFNGKLECVGYAALVISDATLAKLDTWLYGHAIFGSYGWKIVNDSPPWPAMDGAAGDYVAETRGYYVFGGWDPTTRNWMFVSHDEGKTWIELWADNQTPPQTGEGAQPRPRHAFAHFVARFGGRVYIYYVGGDNTDAIYSNGPADVWRYDVLANTFERMSNENPYGQGVNRMARELAGTIYVWGGQAVPSDGSTAQNFMWKSEDEGRTFSLVNASCVWSGRGIGATEVLDGKIYMIGGGTNDNDDQLFFNGVFSFDGLSSDWVQVLPDGHLQFLARDYVSAFVFRSKIWFGAGKLSQLLGGIDDLWKSPDGATWTSHAFSKWGARHANTFVAGPDVVLELGGKAGSDDDTKVFRLELI